MTSPGPEMITDPKTGIVYRLPRLEVLPPVYRVRVPLPRGPAGLVEAASPEAAVERAETVRREAWTTAIAELPDGEPPTAGGLPNLRWRADLQPATPATDDNQDITDYEGRQP